MTAHLFNSADCANIFSTLYPRVDKLFANVSLENSTFCERAYASII